MKQALDKLRNLLAGMAVALFALIFCLIVVEIEIGRASCRERV